MPDNNPSIVIEASEYTLQYILCTLDSLWNYISFPSIIVLLIPGPDTRLVTVAVQTTKASPVSPMVEIHCQVALADLSSTLTDVATIMASVEPVEA